MNHELLIAIALFHAALLMLLDLATAGMAFRFGKEAGVGVAIFGMFIAALIVIPGAVIAWKSRSDGLSLPRWIGTAGPYWLVVGAISQAGSRFPNVLLPASLLCGVLAMLLWANAEVIAPRRRRRILKVTAETAHTAPVAEQKEVQGTLK